MDEKARQALIEIQRRKDAAESPCEMCNATGQIRGFICDFCLGQEITLTDPERESLLFLAQDNRILNEEYLD